MINELIVNAALLIILSGMYGLLGKLNRFPKIYRILSGLLFGGIAIAGMILPFHISKGIIYDGRSIILTLAGLFGGGTVSLIAGVMAGIYRAALGGSGVWAGLATIAVCSLIGLIVRRNLNNQPEKITFAALYGLGIVAHAAMLLCQLLIPWAQALQIIRIIWVPIMLIFPIATLFIGLLLRNEAERQCAEQSLKESGKKFRTVIEESAEIVFTIDDSGYFTYVNPAGLVSSGYTLDELKKMKYIDLIEPDYKQRVKRNYFRQYLERKALSTTEYPFRTKSGNFKWFNQNARLIIENDKIHGFYVIARDVTERRIAQQALQESEEKYRQLVEHSPDAVLIHTEGIIRFVNASSVRLFEAKSKENLIGKKIIDLVHPDYVKIVKQRIDNIIEKGIIAPLIEEKLITLKGNFFDAEVVGVPIIIFGEKGVQDIARDITARKRAEAKLKESELRFRTVWEKGSDGMWLTNEQGIVILANEAYCKMMEKPREEIEGKPLSVVYEVAKHTEVLQKHQQRFRSRSIPPHFERELVLWNGKKLFLELSNSFLEFLPEPIVALSIFRDITERKQAEIALRESEERFRRLFEDLGDAVFVTKIGGIDRGVIMEVNPAAEKQTGYTRNELIGKNIIKDISIRESAEISTDEWEHKLHKGEIVPIIEKKRKKDGTEYWTEVIVTPIEYKGVKASLSINHDITERKQSEEQIKKSLKEKEILLKEIHHRVKNNMQVVASLLGLQSKKVTDSAIKELFNDSINRVYAMAAVHEKLYRTKNFSSINFNSYVHDLIEKLFNLSGLSYRVKLEVDIQDIAIGIDDAIPLALIINELFTNAIKHAFPGDRKGTIKIKFFKAEDETYQLLFQDNGVGIPKHVNFETTESLGLHLVKLLAMQIGGQAALDRDGWSTFRINFKGYDSDPI